MFDFDLSTLSERDIADTMEACRLMRELVSGQDSNPLFVYLRDLIETEATRRSEHGLSQGPANILLPIGESTGHHILCFTRLAVDVICMAQDDRPALAQFYGAVVTEIESAVSRVASAQMN